MIEFKNVSVTYRGGVRALRHVDLTIDEGELVVVVGLSGAGKSTLLRAMNGLVPTTEGSITVGGTEVVGASSAELRDIRSRIGMIFQTFNLVHRTSVVNNVLMGRLAEVPAWRSTLGLWPADDREAAMVALERVGIVEKAYVRAADLSGGQQQRVGIARALAQEPSVMLADEPVAALDPVTSRQVMGDLQRINRDLGITTLINLHFLDLAREYGRRLVGLREGEIVFDGDINDVTDETFLENLRPGHHRRRPEGVWRVNPPPETGRVDDRTAGRTTTSSRPTRPRVRPRTWIVAAAVLAYTVAAGRTVGFNPSTFWQVWSNPLWEKFWPIPWDWVLDRHNVIDPLIETFQIAIVSTILGCGLALPVALAMSPLTSPNRVVLVVTRSIMNVVRAVPDLFWAKLLVTAVGIGAFAGSWALSVFSLAVMVKLFSEAVDGADPRPLEAARAAGGRHMPVVRNGVLPTVLPEYVAYGLYVFELNIRASLVLGLVGAGGIGRVVEAQRQYFRFDRVLGVLVIVFVVVFVIEQVSVAIRKRLV